MSGDFYCDLDQFRLRHAAEIPPLAHEWLAIATMLNAEWYGPFMNWITYEIRPNAPWLITRQVPVTDARDGQLDRVRDIFRDSPVTEYGELHRYIKYHPDIVEIPSVDERQRRTYHYERLYHPDGLILPDKAVAQ